MQISELKEQLSTGKPIDEIIEIKIYIPIAEKRLIANKIINSCITKNENNLDTIDYFYKMFTSDISLLVNYTDIDFSDELMELINEYDYLTEMGYTKFIINSIPVSEKNFIMDLVEDELAQIVRINNSIENIVNQKSKQLIEVVEQKLQQFIDRVPDSKQLKSLSKSLVKDINKMDWDKVPMLKQMWQTANFKQGDGDGK